MKALGYTQIKFKKNDGEWHDLMCSKVYYEKPHETKENIFTYEEFLNKDFEIREDFLETKDSIFPWGKKCLHWKNWMGNESEWIYPGDTLTFKQVWMPENNISFHKLMEKMRAEDFITYCKEKGISIAVNTQC